MAFWNYREELSMADKLTRSYYELLRDELDYFLIQYALIDSYRKICQSERTVPFVEKREMKPRARIPDREYECQNAFLVMFVENTIPTEHKKYIRFFDDNRTQKQNLLRSKSLQLADNFDRNWKYLESIHFSNFLKSLLPVDYALLIQTRPGHRQQESVRLVPFSCARRLAHRSRCRRSGPPSAVYIQRYLREGRQGRRANPEEVF